MLVYLCLSRCCKTSLWTAQDLETYQLAPALVIFFPACWGLVIPWTHPCHLSFNLFWFYSVLSWGGWYCTEYSRCRCTMDLYSVVMMAFILFSVFKILVPLFLMWQFCRTIHLTSRSHFREVMVSSQPIALYAKIKLFFLCAFVCTEFHVIFLPIIASIVRSFSIHHSSSFS